MRHRYNQMCSGNETSRDNNYTFNVIEECTHTVEAQVL